ncbi:MAG: DUF2255 family protein [Chloroflexi bacterium]|nr:DUF2255 family protein [Chloroflexota bacterium]MCC6891429.1 DUF2255 family protein [Anaerolineae bacterium]
MTTWTNDELRKVEAAEELEIASQRGDGTLRKSRTIWVVRVGDSLYVRSVNGRTSDWFRGVETRHEGHIKSGGVDKDVSFVEVDTTDSIHAQIDNAYRKKYSRYAANIINSTLTPKAHSATLKLVPR